MNASSGDVVTGVMIAAITALTITLVLWMGKIAGRWFTKALSHSFGEQVVEVMAPDMARLGTRLGSAIDDLRESNTLEHRADQARLTSVEQRIAAMEESTDTRLMAIESKLGMRAPDARTRAGDQE